MRIALIYNEPLPSRYHALGEEIAVTSVLESVRAVEEALLAKGHLVQRLGLQPPLSGAIRSLESVEADLIFNLFEGFDGRPQTEWLIAGFLAMIGRPITGASAVTLALCLDKARAKELLAAHQIPTAPYQLLDPSNVAEFALEFPVIVKPLREDGSHGLGPSSVVHDLPSLAKQVQSITDRYGSPTLVESFLPGREFNAAILGSRSPRLLPLSEMVYSPKMPHPKILTYEAKWHYQSLDFQASTAMCPAQVSEALQREIEGLALAAHAALGAPPYARVDLRADAHGRLHVLEVNPNPDLSPETGIALQAISAGMEYGELIQTILDLALESLTSSPSMGEGGDGGVPRPSTIRDTTKTPRHQENDFKLRPMRPQDVAALVRITRDTGFFRPDEVTTAQEVLEECVAKGESSGYYVHVSEESGNPLGYVCFGPTPLTIGTWDLYWIAVAPEHQGRGIGTRLIRLAEAEMCQRGGRQVLVETSSQELYAPTRRFYCSSGYQEVSRVPDFYDLGDAKVIFAKSLPRACQGAVPQGGGPPMRP